MKKRQVKKFAKKGIEQLDQMQVISPNYRQENKACDFHLTVKEYRG